MQGSLCIVLLATLLGTNFAEDVSGQDDYAPYTISPFAKIPGIHYEKLDNMRTHNTVLKLVTYVSLEHLLVEPQAISNDLKQIYIECTNLRDSCTVMHSIKSLQERILSITKSQVQISELVGRSRIKSMEAGSSEFANRRKRTAFLPPLGSLMKMITGNLDEADLTYLNGQIDRVFNDTGHLATLMSEQTIILKSSINHSNTAFHNISNVIEGINSRLDQMRNESATTLKLRYADKYNLLLIEDLFQISMYLSEYEMEMNTVADAILFAKQGMIHNTILSPGQLVSRLRDLQPSTINHDTLRFPVPLKNEFAEELIRISRLTVTCIGSRLIYVLLIPLLNDKVFNLYKLTPVPVGQNFGGVDNNKYAYVKPSTRYLAVAQDRQSYVSLTDEEFRGCQVSLNNYLCEHQLLYHTGKTQSCEMNILLEPNDTDFKSCDIRIKDMSAPYWVQLVQSNSWIFSIAAKETITVDCPNMKRSISRSLAGSGILTINNTECSVITDTITLSSLMRFKSVKEVDYPSSVSLNITTLYGNLTDSLKFLNIPVTTTAHKTHFDASDLMAPNTPRLDVIMRKTAEIGSHHREEQPSEFNIYAISGTAVGVTVFVIGTIFAAHRFSIVTEILAAVGCRKTARKKRRTNRKNRGESSDSSDCESGANL